MADPLTILGASAASFQCASYAIKSLFKTIELIEDVRDVSQRMPQLLGHIDREVELINELLRPDSPVFTQLSITQYSRISKPAIEARKLLVEIQQDLCPLVDISEDQSKSHGKWKAIVRVGRTLKKEKRLEAKAKLLDRLNTSLLRELQISGFETGSLLRDQNSQILTNITTSATSKSQSLDQIRDELNGLRQKISGSTMLSSIQFRTQLSNHRSEIQTLIQDIGSELKDELIGLAMKYAHNHNSNPIDTKNSIFEIDLRRETARFEASSYAIQPGSEPKEGTKFCEYLKPWRCKCRTGTYTTRWTCGRLGFRFITQPAQQCLVHGPKRACSYSIEAKLTPFLKGTLELTLGLFSRRKGWEISPYLRFKSIVKRSESPIFQLFDQFAESLVNDLSSKNRDQYVHNNRKAITGAPLYLAEKEQFIRENVPRLVRRVEEVIRSGWASGGDADENGCTLLIETFYLVILLGTRAYDVAKALNQLTQLARISEIDTILTSKFMNKNHLIDNSTESQCLTAIQTLVGYYQGPMVTGSSFYHRLRDYDELFDPLSSFEYQNSSTLNHNSKLFLIYPEAAEGIGHSDLCLAVIHRRLADLQELCPTSQLELGPETGRRGQLSPTTLAVGWPEGLHLLVDRGCDIAQAFDLTCARKDEKSASILLSTNRPIFSRNYTEWYLSDKHKSKETSHPFWVLSIASSCMPIFRIATEELRRRREDIKKLTLLYLNQDERNRLGLPSSWAMDENGREIYRLLEQRTIVPKELDCLAGGSPHCSWNVRSTQHHGVLYDAGFTNLNVPCRHNKTPLAELCEDSYVTLMKHMKLPGNHDSNLLNRPDREVLLTKCNDGIIWFLERGAWPNFCFGDNLDPRWPHLLFYLCLAVSPAEACNQAIDTCSYGFVADQCECFCSSGGCIPPFLFWRCDNDEHIYCKIRLAHRTENLRRWTKALNLGSTQKEYWYREICQLELFERLGMGHTCCKSRRSTTEAREIRSEDMLSARQLMQLLHLYKRTRKLLINYPIEEFWTVWWEAVDNILPPLLPEDACNRLSTEKGHRRVVERREFRWIATLDAAGYRELDFGEVIKRHFTKFFVLCKALVERRGRWRRYRLVASPTSTELRRRLRQRHGE
ncbi:hypothetical protein F5Y13DRAFT_189528 [Hypoxylon sp. FL1857]|nr:hypothetical protein F5Y13DRAFT_189528 [Hypoxylon sp. FL1857]